MSTFLVYLYKKKPLRPSRGPYTSVHLNTCTPNSVSHLGDEMIFFFSKGALHSCRLLFSLHVSLVYIIQSAQRTGLYYSLCTAHWVILLIHFYRGGLSYSAIFTVVGYLTHPFLPWWVILLIHFYRGGLSYSSIFTVVGYLTHPFLPWWVILLIHFYRGGLSYSSIFTVVGYLTHHSSTTGEQLTKHTTAVLLCFDALVVRFTENRGTYMYIRNPVYPFTLEPKMLTKIASTIWLAIKDMATL